MTSEDDEAFGCLGIPTPLEMWKHHAHLLETELEGTRRDLRTAHQNIAKLIEMYRAACLETNMQKVQVEKLSMEVRQLTSNLSAAYLELSNLKNSAMVMQVHHAGSPWG